MTQLMARPSSARPRSARPASTARPVMPMVAVGVLLSGFDLFVVNVALDRIAASIGGSNLADLSWVLNAYTITFAALLVPAGRIGGMVGSKRNHSGRTITHYQCDIVRSSDAKTVATVTSTVMTPRGDQAAGR